MPALLIILFPSSTTMVMTTKHSHVFREPLHLRHAFSTKPTRWRKKFFKKELLRHIKWKLQYNVFLTHPYSFQDNKTLPPNSKNKSKQKTKQTTKQNKPKANQTNKLLFIQLPLNPTFLPQTHPLFLGLSEP